MYSSDGSLPLPSHLTSSIPTNSNLYLDSSLKSVKVSLGRLPYTNSYIPSSISQVHILLVRSFIQRVLPGPGLFRIFYNKLLFSSEGLLATHSTPKLEGHPLSFVHSCLFNIFQGNFHSWRLSLHPQPLDTQCCGDKGSTYHGPYKQRKKNPLTMIMIFLGNINGKTKWDC
jgi:hypothetical protein